MKALLTSLGLVAFFAVAIAAFAQNETTLIPVQLRAYEKADKQVGGRHYLSDSEVAKIAPSKACFDQTIKVMNASLQGIELQQKFRVLKAAYPQMEFRYGVSNEGLITIEARNNEDQYLASVSEYVPGDSGSFYEKTSKCTKISFTSDFVAHLADQLVAKVQLYELPRTKMGQALERMRSLFAEPVVSEKPKKDKKDKDNDDD